MVCVGRRARPILAALLLTALLTVTDVPQAPPVQAGGFQIYWVNDPIDWFHKDPVDGNCVSYAGTCTLRAAIQAANFSGGSTSIELQAQGPYVLVSNYLNSTDDDDGLVGDLDVNSHISIFNVSNAPLEISMSHFDNGHNHRVIDVGPKGAGGSLFIRDVTIKDGKELSTDNGGGIRVNGQGTLELRNVTLADNEARGGQSGAGIYVAPGGSATLTNVTVSGNDFINPDYFLPAHGGGIANDGTLTLSSVTISGNSAIANTDPFQFAPGSGAGLYNGVNASATLTNVTISGNTALKSPGPPGGHGGGIFNKGSLTLVNVTIASNVVTGTGIGSNVYNDDITPGAQIKAANTIVANGQGAGNCTGPAFLSSGGNLSSDGTCVVAQPGKDFVNTNPLLGPLKLNTPVPAVQFPGTTATHALLPGSPAIDHGVGGVSCAQTDQRNVTRPQDGDGNGSDVCDIGAFEAQALPAPSVFCQPRPKVGVAVLPSGPSQLTVTISAATNSVVTSNHLAELQFGPATNGLIDIPGGQSNATGSFTVSLAAGTQQTGFLVRRAAPGPVHVPLTVVDTCGPWRTFVGMGNAVP